MANTYVLRKDVSSVLDLKDGDAAYGAGVGNRYYVAKTTDTAVYNWLVANRQHTYSDGTRAVQSDIQVALDATVECRNDYVYVWPSDSDYDTTAALTLSKKSVHLICPAGMGFDRGANNACRIHQNTGALAILTITDTSVEVAGFFFKNYADIAAVNYTTPGYSPNLHHCTFNMQLSASPQSIITMTTDAGQWGSIHHNLFMSGGGDDVTIASIIAIASQATGARVEYNDFFIGDGTVATAAVSNLATKGVVNYNNFMMAGGDGSYTHCVAIGTYGSAIGNRGTVADSILVSGGVNDASFSDNMNGVNGGLIDDLD